MAGAGASGDEGGTHQRTGWRGDWRQITALFCDLVGWTEWTHRLDPEDLLTMTSAYYALCCGCIERHGGHAARLEGDGALAYFGYPLAREDAVADALRAALDIRESLARDGLAGKTGVAVRIGMATGMAIVSDLVGEGYSEAGVALGPSPNLAKRLQVLAEPGDILVSDETRRLAGAGFSFEAQGPHQVRGFAQPQDVWRLRCAAYNGLRHEHRKVDGSPCVGRDTELGGLRRAWRSARQGQGGAILVVGEAGIGKSRVLRALAESSEVPATCWWQCAPGQQASPLQPVRAWLRRLMAADDATEALSCLRDWLGPDSAPDGPALLADLAGWPVPPGPDLPSDRRGERILEILLAGMRHQCGMAPLLLLLEDVHWADAATEEFLRVMLRAVPTWPMLVVLTTRPPSHTVWTEAASTVMALGPLALEDARLVALGVSRNEPLSGPELDEVLAVTDGVPLFVEEMTASVLASRRHADPDTAARRVPSTLHDTLAARLDHLGDSRELATIGSALGREFSALSLANVCGWPADRLEVGLARLVDAGLLSPRTPVGTHVFKHALVQQAAYDRLLRSDRRRLHRRIIEVLESEDPDLATREPALLAHHCQQADLPEREAAHWHTAARAAVRIAAIKPALAAYEQAEAALSRLSQTPNHVREHIEVLLGMMEAGRFAILPDRLAALAERASELASKAAVELGPTARTALLFQDARAKLYTSRYGEARAVFEDMRRLGRDNGDAALERRPGSALAMTLGCQGLFEPMLAFLNEDKLEDYRASGNLIDHLAGLGWLSYARCQTGWGNEGLTHADRAVSEAGTLQSPVYLGGALVWRSHALAALRRLDEAVLDAQRSHDLGVQLGVPYLQWHALVFLSLYQARRGQAAAAHECLGRARDLLRQAAQGTWTLLDYLPAIESEILLAEGRPEAAMLAADEALRVAEPIEGYFAKAMACRTRALGLLALGRPLADARAAIDRCLQIHRDGGAHAEAGFTSLLWARVLQASGYAEEGRGALADAAERLRAAKLQAHRMEALADRLWSLGASDPTSEHGA